jgi:hypothetical protein
MRNLIIGCVILLGLFLILPFFGIDTSIVFRVVIEWIYKIHFALGIFVLVNQNSKEFREKKLKAISY